MEDNWLKIGIVILNYKTFQDTHRLVCEILKQYTRFELFIQVVDNDSPNESFEILTDLFAGLSNINISSSGVNGGFAKGNNFGLNKIKSFNPKYVLILNNDVHFDLSLVDKLVLKYEELDSPGILSPLQKLPNGYYASFPTLLRPSFLQDILSNSYISGYFRKSFQYKSDANYLNVQEVDIIPGCFIFIDYLFFSNIGFFDEVTFLFCEERFLSKKISVFGRRNYLLLDCFYTHEHSKTINQEVDKLAQKRLILDGQIAYTKLYRKYAWIKVVLLRIAFSIYCLEFSLLKYLRRLNIL